MTRRVACLSVLALAGALGVFWKSRLEEDRSISTMGSGAMLQLSFAWKEAYQSVSPETQVTVDGRGTGTGLVGLTYGMAQLAMASRPIKALEKDRIRVRHGTEPVQHVVGHQAIAVFVHPSNPVSALSMSELREIWAEGGKINNWNQVGGPDLVIERRSGYHLFRNIVCGNRIGFKPRSTTNLGTFHVVDFCAETPGAIVFAGVGFMNPSLKLIAVSRDGNDAFPPTPEAIVQGNYPLARPLYIYTIGKARGTVREYLEWIKGPKGQAVLEDEDFFPVYSK